MNYSAPSSHTNNQCVTIDLEKTYDLDEVALWNYFGDPRSYYNNKTYVSKDNSNWNEILNEASIETSNGHRINAYTNTYNGYVSDGLVLWYDGFANTGTDRNNTSSTWKNLANSSYSGTLKNSPTWYGDYLLFDGTNDSAKTNQSINYNGSKSFTIQFVGIVYKKTTSSIIFESSENSNNNSGSYYVDTLEYGDRDITLAMKYGSIRNHKKANKILDDNKALYTIIFDSTKETNKYISIYKNLEKYTKVIMYSI